MEKEKRLRVPSRYRDYERFILGNKKRYHQALRKALKWLDQFSEDPRNRPRLDPYLLSHKDMNGLKKLFEFSASYFSLWKASSGSRKVELKNRLREVLSPAKSQNLYRTWDLIWEVFKLPGCLGEMVLLMAYYLNESGLGATRVLQEFRKRKEIIDRFSGSRKGWRKEHTRWLYRYFTLEEPFSHYSGFTNTLIKRRVSLRKYDLEMVYELTHELFAFFQWNHRLDKVEMRSVDQRYVNKALDYFMRKFMAEADDLPLAMDIVPELVSCSRLVRNFSSREFQKCLIFILDSQNQDGSWGDFPLTRKEHGKNYERLVRIHPTEVALDALTISFGCPPLGLSETLRADMCRW